MTTPAPTSEQPLLLSGGAIFDDETRSFQAGVDVLCRDGRIAWLSANSSEVPDGTRTLDCRGKYIIPGLIDCHVHITGSGDPTELNAANTASLPLRSWKAAQYAEATLAAGFTTVRDLGAADRLNIELSKAVENGLLRGPRILAAGLGVTMTGGHGHGFLAREADGPEEVRKAVREQLRACY